MTNPQSSTAADQINRLLAAGRPQEAVEAARQVCQAAGAGSRDWLLYGRLSFNAGDLVTARAALGKAAKIEPDLAEAQFEMGKLLATVGEFPAAIDRLEKASQLQPDNADIWLTLGITHGLAKEPVKAEECCRRSLQTKRGSAQALFNLANALLAQGKLSEAEAEYEKALEIEAGMVAGWSMLAQARVGLRKFAEAEAAAHRALTLEPRYGEAHFTLGGILETRGDVQQARDHFQQATKCLPRLADAHMRLGAILHQLGDLPGAAESCQNALALDSGMTQAHFLLGEILNNQKFLGKAAMSYRKVVTLNNDHLQAHYRLAFLLMAVGQQAESAKHFAEILRINPKDEQARHLLAAQRGEMPATAPAEYVSKLFDGLADTFDSKLVDKLDYRTPELLHKMVSQFVAPAANSLDVIDLGCGTGLCAPLFRDMARKLHGVDLSPRMIEKARERKLYDTLGVGDITAALMSKPAAWDLAIVADVFVYVGALEEVFAACGTALKPGGYLAFSVESDDDSESFVLRNTGRYAHASNYIRSLSAAADLLEIERRAAVLRREQGKDVNGYLFLLQRTVDVLQ